MTDHAAGGWSAPKLRVMLGALAASIPLDQITKAWVEATVPIGSRVPVIEGFFYVTHARNTGAVLGLGRDMPPEVASLVFGAIALVAVLLVLGFYQGLAPGERLKALSLGLILGGALGNLCDRVRLGEVVDFLHFKLWQGYSWPDFNLADSFIVVGVGLLILELIAIEGGEESESESA